MSITTTARRGRPPKNEGAEVTTKDFQPSERLTSEQLNKNIKLIIRAISVNNQFNPDGSVPLEAVESYVNQYLNSGYRLERTQFIRTHTAADSPQPVAIEMLFV